MNKTIALSLMISFAALAAADRSTYARLRSPASYACKQEEVEPPYTRMQKLAFWCGVCLLVVAPVVQAYFNGNK